MYHLILNAGTPETGAGGGLMSFLPIILIFGILYFLMIRPQQKRQKELQKMISELEINDVVVTSGGIIGKIVNFKKDKDIVILKVDETNNVKIEVRRAAIAGLVKETTAKEVSKANDETK